MIRSLTLALALTLTLALTLALALTLTLSVARYAIFRGANSQKDAFRRDPNDPAVAHLQYMQTATGRRLLTSGWCGLGFRLGLGLRVGLGIRVGGRGRGRAWVWSLALGIRVRR